MMTVAGRFLCRDFFLRHLCWTSSRLPQSRNLKTLRSWVMPSCPVCECPRFTKGHGCSLTTGRGSRARRKQRQRSLPELGSVLQMSKKPQRIRPVSHDSRCATTKVRPGPAGLLPELPPASHRWRSGKPVGHVDDSAGYIPVCHLVTSLQKQRRCVTPLTDT